MFSVLIFFQKNQSKESILGPVAAFLVVVMDVVIRTMSLGISFSYKVAKTQCFGAQLYLSYMIKLMMPLSLCSVCFSFL